MARKIPIPVELILDSPLTSNPDAMQVFMHLLARANYKDGNRFKRGECPIGRVELGKATGQSPSKIERVLDKLVSMCLIQMRLKSNTKSNNEGRVVTIVQYDRYDGFDATTGQHIGQSSDNGRTMVGQSSDTLTALQPLQPSNLTAKTKETPVVPKGTRFIKPSLEEVTDYIHKMGYSVDPVEFVYYQDSVGWVIGAAKKPMKDWQAAVRTWQHKRCKESKPHTPMHPTNKAKYVEPTPEEARASRKQRGMSYDWERAEDEAAEAAKKNNLAKGV